MGYIQIKEIGRVYAMEPGDRVLRSGLVVTAGGVTVAGKCADPKRVAQWLDDGLIEEKKAAPKKAAKKKAKAGEVD